MISDFVVSILNATRTLPFFVLPRALHAHPPNIYKKGTKSFCFRRFGRGVNLYTPRLPPHFERLLGIPLLVLQTLSFIPPLFIAIDIFGYLKAYTQGAYGLRLIALANCSYYIFATILLIQNREGLTLYGWTYHVGESVLIAALASYEIKLSFSTNFLALHPSTKTNDK